MPSTLHVCLNGSRTRAEHPRVPLTAAELADDARRCVRAGAVAVHVHVREPSGAETLDPDLVNATVDEIKRAVPGVPVGVTTGAWIEPDPARRRQLIERWHAPDVASVNLSEAGHADVMAALLAAGVGVEAGIFEPGDVRRLSLTGMAEDVVRVLVEPGAGGGPAARTDPVALAAAIERALDAAAIPAPRLHHGETHATWAVLRAAIARGRDIRIGLEDTLVAADGSRAWSNAALVREARALLP